MQTESGLRRHQRKRRNTSGAALWIALAMMALLSIGASAAWRHMHTTMAYQKRCERMEQCRNFAEAGLEMAVARLQAAPAYRGENGVPLGEGTFSMAVEMLDAGVYQLASTGSFKGGAHTRYKETMHARLELEHDGAIRAYYLCKEPLE
jgi:hypothetical protein